MVTKLMEVARNAFGAWRDHEGLWSMNQFEALSKLLGNKIMLGDAPPELFEVSLQLFVYCVPHTLWKLGRLEDNSLAAQ